MAIDISNAKVLNTKYVYIEKNVVIFNNRFICVSNISMISMYKKRKDYSEQKRIEVENDRRLSAYARIKSNAAEERDSGRILGIVGILVLIFIIIISGKLSTGWVLLLLLGGIIMEAIGWSKYAKAFSSLNMSPPDLLESVPPPDEFGVIVYLNSGNRFCLESKNEFFIKNVAKTMLECINQKQGEQGIVINFENSTIETMNATEISLDTVLQSDITEEGGDDDK